MAQQVRIKLNKGAVGALLKGAPMQAILRRAANGIAASAGPGHAVHVTSGGKRARAEVVTETFDAMRREARDRNLTRAIGSAR
jgi:hypothetical protein